MNIGLKIRKLRLDNKLSQAELANKLDVTQRSISNFESSKTIPNFIFVQKICEVFNVSVDYFAEENPISKKANSSEEIVESLLKRIEDLESLH